MKTRLLIIAIIIAVIMILVLTVKIKPFDDYPGNHIEELKQIPEVNMFYEKYGDYGVSVFPDGAYSYQVGFQSGTSEDQWIMLKLNYRFGFLSNVLIHCTPEGIQSQYTVRDNVLEYLLEKNCFDVESEQTESETKKLWKSTDDWNSLGLIRNDDSLYCSSASEESSDHCYSIEEIVFGNARKGWTVYPGGAGWMPPQNSTLVRIYKEVTIGIPPLNFTAMLDDKIFVNKCESNGGVWDYTYHDCGELWQVCGDVGGIMIQERITTPCTSGVCLDRVAYRISCVFEYEN